MRSSMGSSFSSLFSISTSSLMPSITIWTSCTSEKPSLSALEMSKTPSTASFHVSGASTFEEPPQTQDACSCVAASHAHQHEVQCPGWMDMSGCRANL
uniref:Uncharacterized protein n=1 Tax=Hippocampus comes TaxID=109280 RepID=A0A3Q2XRT6_HIPCM